MQQERFTLLEQAFDFAYPLVSFQHYVNYFTNTVTPTEKQAPINQFFHARSISKPEEKLAAPNMEVVYSQAWLNLKEEPYCITKPATERGFNICLNDAYGDCIAVMGDGGTIGSKEEAVYALTGPGFSGTLPEGVIEIKNPTSYAYLLVRAKINDINSQQELEEIHGLQNAMDLRPLSTYGGDYEPPTGTYSDAYTLYPLMVLATQLEIESFFQLYNQLVADNPGLAADVEYAKRFLPVHVGPGETFRLSDFTQEEQDFLRALPHRPRAATAPGSYSLNNWDYMPPRYGRYEGDYALRAYLAFTGFGQNFPEMSSYPSAHTDQYGEPLTGAHKYIFHFPADGFPPLQEEIGYWGLTVYHSEDYTLIDNPIHRYSMKDSQELVRNQDGSLTIYLQTEEPEPEKKSNWLPICEGGFLACMRFYYPKADAINGTYKLPYIQRID